jgi:hypothetical protein
MRKSFDIFLGGPMGGRKKDPASLAFSKHIGRLKEAIDRISDELNIEQSQWTVRSDTPVLDDTGMIEQRVFGIIDRAELGIMDISADSPSVMYELAMLHALGIPTIPISFRGNDGKRVVPFYLRGTYQAVVESFEVEELYQILRPMVRNVVFGGASGSDPNMNPMTAYYGLPLVDISASTGLATGYFHNFLQHILKDMGGVFDYLDGQVEKLVVIRPRSLAEAASLKHITERRLAEEGIEVELIGERDGKVYTDREQARGMMLVFRAGSYIFDAPSPLAAQEKSPRMKRIRKQLIQTAGRGPVSEEAREMVAKFEERMIEEFMSVLERLPEEYHNARPDRLAFATLDEFVEMARQAPDS